MITIDAHVHIAIATHLKEINLQFYCKEFRLSKVCQTIYFLYKGHRNILSQHNVLFVAQYSKVICTLITSLYSYIIEQQNNDELDNFNISSISTTIKRSQQTNNQDNDSFSL